MHRTEKDPDVIIDGAGYRLENSQELGTISSMAGCKGIEFPSLTTTKRRLSRVKNPRGKKKDGNDTMELF